MIPTYRSAALALILLALPVQPLFAQASDKLIESIMTLRSEVEQLYASVQDGQQDHRANMRSYAAQLADLEAQINRQQISLRQLELDIVKTQTEIKSASDKNVSIRPQLNAGIAQLRKLIGGGLPFRIPERLDDLQQLQSQLDSGSLTEERTLGRVWAGFEDLLRMTRENGLSRQEIVLDGEPLLAMVAKVGSVMLFFAAPNDVVGYAERRDGKIVYVRAQTIQQREQINALIDAYEKQIRSGYFTLPAKFVFSGDQP